MGGAQVWMAAPHDRPEVVGSAGGIPVGPQLRDVPLRTVVDLRQSWGRALRWQQQMMTVMVVVVVVIMW